jgi:hypothetical protein
MRHAGESVVDNANYKCFYGGQNMENETFWLTETIDFWGFY